MATGRRSMLQETHSPSHSNDPGRDLFEACRNGDLNKVKKLVNPQNVNSKDTAGRKSTPLHFAAGALVLIFECKQKLEQEKCRPFAQRNLHHSYII